MIGMRQSSKYARSRIWRRRRSIASRWWTVLALLALAASACAPAPEVSTAAGTADEGGSQAAPATGAAQGEGESAPLDYPKWQTASPGSRAEYNQRTNLIQRGHLVYAKYCIGCHGVNGDGQGPAAVRLLTKPRDFTSGIYKFRSTDSSSLPLESDLYRTITRGLARVSMPAFDLMPESEKVAVIEYVKTFYPRWEEEKDARKVVYVPRAPADLKSEQRMLRGQVVYLQMQCWKCHGIDGRGTDATQTEYTDAWGHPQRPFDFTRGSLKGGNAPEDIYRTFHTGLRSIMPSYGGETLAAVTADSFDAMKGPLSDEDADRLRPVLDAFPATADDLYGSMTAEERTRLAERNSWDLVAYILSLHKTISTAEAVLGTAAGG